MTRDQIGRLVGGAIGLLFIQMSTDALPTGVCAFLRFVAIATFLSPCAAERRGAALARPAE